LQKLLLIILFYSSSSFSQELFVNSEPASTFPARSLGVKVLANYVPYDKVFDRAAERYLTQVMIGIAKNFSLSLGAGFSNMHTSDFERESFSLFCKYRFFSQDDVHKHFRMAAFLDASYSYAPFHNDEAELTGDKGGISLGVIATKLLNKVALSTSISHTQILDSSRFNETVYVPTRIYKAMNYSISSGYLLIPREYKNFNQLNVNLYMELLAEQTLTQNKYYIDIAPAVQFIINSNLKLNISYRKEITGNMSRISDYKWLFGVERNFLNAWKKKSN
jgi:hypothetical protein